MTFLNVTVWYYNQLYWLQRDLWEHKWPGTDFAEISPVSQTHWLSDWLTLISRLTREYWGGCSEARRREGGWMTARVCWRRTHTLALAYSLTETGGESQRRGEEEEEWERGRECLLRGWLSFLVHKPALAETSWAVSAPAPSVRPSPFWLLFFSRLKGDQPGVEER